MEEKRQKLNFYIIFAMIVLVACLGYAMGSYFGFLNGAEAATHELLTYINQSCYCLN